MDLGVIEKEKVLDFLLSGKAEFVIRNMKTGIKYRYKVIKSKKADIYAIYVFDASAYVYAGALSIVKYAFDKDFDRSTDNIKYTSSYKISYFKGNGGAYEANHPSVRGILYVLMYGEKCRPEIEVLHMGKCGHCGRKLKDPDSIKRGLGPDCAKRVEFSVFR